MTSKVKELLENRNQKREEKANIEEVFEKIKSIVNRDNEIDPYFFGEIFFDIISLSAIPLNDQERYIKYSFNEINRRIINKMKKEAENGKTN